MFKIMGALAIAVLILFSVVLLTTLLGAVIGWVVGLFFSETILGTLAAFGVNTTGIVMWQLGATLGFVGGFFRTPITKA